MYEMTDRDAKALVRLGGFVPDHGGPVRPAAGYRCGECGFGSFFRTCSRCGNTECERAR